MSQLWTPHDYQVRGMEHILTNGGAALWLDPGMGKTSIVLGAQKVLREQGEAPMLVFAPIRVAQHVWTAEAKKWADFNDLKIAVVWGPDREKYLVPGYDVYVVNYENLEWFFEHRGVERTGVKTLVCDESPKLKNPAGVRFKTLRANLNKFSRRWILTGTPATRNYEDLWSQFFIVDGGIALGRYVTHFRNQFFYQTSMMAYDRHLRDGADVEIMDKIKPYVLRMDAADYLELPELVVNDVLVALPDDAQGTYESLWDEFITVVNDKTVTAVNKAVAFGRCLQICNGALYTDPDGTFETVHTAKIDALSGLLSELGGTQPIIFYQFNHDLERLQEAFPWLPHIGAGVNRDDTEKLIDAFNKGQLPGLLAHPGSVGHGLQLQGHANHIIFFGVTHDLDLYLQPIARVWRQGNPNSHVFVHRILADHTCEMDVAKRLAEKDAVQADLMDYMERV